MADISIFRDEPNKRQLAAGEVIFEAGDAGEHMYAVIEGKVEIERDGTVVETIEPGGFFGELAILDKSYTRAATARAAEDAVLAEIDETRFLFLTKLNPIVSIQVMRHLAERIRRGW